MYSDQSALLNWGLRDYGTGTWEGGDPGCDHVQLESTRSYVSSTLGPKCDGLGPNNAAHLSKYTQYQGGCRRCGARRVDQQLGSEARLDCLGWAQGVNCAVDDWANGCHICRMVLVCRDLRRVLRDDGTFWLNLGDSYTSNPAGNLKPRAEHGNGEGRLRLGGGKQALTLELGRKKLNTINAMCIGAKQLLGIPWRVALALQADGWVLRQDIVWSKPAPMPESVRGRCTKSHEYIFLLTKRGSGYYYDAEAVKERQKGESESRQLRGLGPDTKRAKDYGGVQPRHGGQVAVPRPHDPSRAVETSCNKRSVWSVDDHQGLLEWLAANDPGLLARYLAEAGYKPDVWRVSSQGYPGAHFATFPPKLIEPCILAGTSERGCCLRCGAPWRRVVQNFRYSKTGTSEKMGNTKIGGVGGYHDQGTDLNKTGGGHWSLGTLGWYPTCSCDGLPPLPPPPATGKDFRTNKGAEGNHYRNIDYDEDRLSGVTDSPDYAGWVARAMDLCGRSAGLPTRPCVVLDPFLGSGTTAVVAMRHGRHCRGIDLSAEYLRNNAVPRIEGHLLGRPALAWLTGRVGQAVALGGEEEG